MEDYKQDIINTRRGCLGSSDGKMLRQICELGEVPSSAHRRLAVVKGFVESKNVTTTAMKAGDEIENAIFNHLSAGDERYESNPLWVSERYSRYNCRLISHPDIVLKDEQKKLLHVYEVKTTSKSFYNTREDYKEQLYIHQKLGMEQARMLGKEWRLRLYLVHYSTAGLDLEDGIDFNPERITIRTVHFNTDVFNIMKAMSIVSKFLDTFNEYYDGDEIDAEYVPAPIRKSFELVEQMLLEIKEREDKIDQFKKKLYEFLQSKNVKSIRSDSYTITRVDPSVTVGTDYKKFFDAFCENHPRKAKKMKDSYRKEIKKNGYVIFKLK